MRIIQAVAERGTINSNMFCDAFRKMDCHLFINDTIQIARLYIRTKTTDAIVIFSSLHPGFQTDQEASKYLNGIESICGETPVIYWNQYGHKSRPSGDNLLIVDGDKTPDEFAKITVDFIDSLRKKRPTALVVGNYPDLFVGFNGDRNLKFTFDVIEIPDLSEVDRITFHNKINVMVFFPSPEKPLVDEIDQYTNQDIPKVYVAFSEKIHPKPRTDMIILRSTQTAIAINKEIINNSWA